MIQQSTTRSGIKPRFFYGYVIVIAAFCIMVAYSAARSSFGVFFDPVAAEFGWSRALLSGPFSLSIVLDGLLAIWMGRLSDRFGPRKVITAGACLAGLAYILMSTITDIWQMYLLYGVMAGVGMGGIFVPIITNLSRWFIARRNIINGIVLAGMGVGTLIIPPLIHWLIAAYQWRMAYIILGIAFLLIIVTAAQFMKKDPAQVGQQPYGLNPQPAGSKTSGLSLSQAVRTRQLWLVFMIFFCFGFSALSINVHIVPHVIHLDISAAVAAAVLATIGGFNILGRVVFGAVGDHLGSIQTYCLGFIIGSLILLWLVVIKDPALFYVFAVIWGFSSGGMGSVQAPMVAELFGLKWHGAIFGVCGLGAMIAGSIGPVFTGYIFDTTGGYDAAFITCAVFALAGIVISLILIRSKNKIAGTGP